jgi:hypothetical protein
MFRNLFGEPKPGTHEELVEVLDELDLNPADCSVVICDYSGENEDPYDGWCAEISGENSEGAHKIFDTVAWKDQVSLRNDLAAAGLKDITVE